MQEKVGEWVRVAKNADLVLGVCESVRVPSSLVQVSICLCVIDCLYTLMPWMGAVSLIQRANLFRLITHRYRFMFRNSL